MSIAFIGLGSNIGNKTQNLKSAIEKLKENQIEILNISSFYKTKPYGYTDQPEFLNAVVKIQTNLSPKELLKTLMKIERKLGRKRTIRWGPRTIDLDILFYDDLIINEKDLIIPHPDLHNREFVLKPLNEIEPEFIHPVLKKKIKQIYSEL